MVGIPLQSITRCLRSFALPLLLSACQSHESSVATRQHEPATNLAVVSRPPPFDGSGPMTFCQLPGSLQFTRDGKVEVPGANTAALEFLSLPNGFCAHYFANVGNTRQLRFAPGGELFVASPTTPTTGGGQGGRAAIVLLADDNHDGYADVSKTFLDQIPSTQGLLFTPPTESPVSSGYFYYQDGTKILAPAIRSGRSRAGRRERS